MTMTAAFPGWHVGLPQICGLMRGIKSYLERQYIHRHNPAELERADLGFDESWHYDLGKGQGLLLRQGNRVIRIEAGATLNSPDVLEKLWVWMEKTK